MRTLEARGYPLQNGENVGRPDAVADLTRHDNAAG
jgi:hypothetical protein